MTNSKKELDFSILAIDPSMRHIGVCYTKKSKIHTVDCLTYGKKLKDEKLLKEIYDDISKYVKKTTPTILAIEGYSYLSVGRVYQLGEVGGVIRLAGAQYGTPIITIPPSRIKKFAGKGNADKQYMVDYVLNTEPQLDAALIKKNNDVADAVVLAKLVSHGLEYVSLNTLPKSRKAAEVVIQIKPTLLSIIEGLDD